MPKDEAALTDPMELSGLVGPVLTDADVAEMTEALVDEYVRLGFDDDELLSLFKNPHYALTHSVWLTRGEAYAREVIARVRERWGNVWRFKTQLGPAAFERDKVDDLLEEDDPDFVPVESLGSLRP
jgi:hypothetical protein